MNEDQSWLYRRMGGKDCKVCNPPDAELNKETNSRLDELLNAVESYREKMGVPTDTQWRVKFDNFMKDWNAKHTLEELDTSEIREEITNRISKVWKSKWVEYSSVDEYIEDDLEVADEDDTKPCSTISEVYQRYQLWSLAKEQYPVYEEDFTSKVRVWYYNKIKKDQLSLNFKL